MNDLPSIGDKYYEVDLDSPSGVYEWKVYLPEVQVPCVRLYRATEDGHVYKDVPLAAWRNP